MRCVFTVEGAARLVWVAPSGPAQRHGRRPRPRAAPRAVRRFSSACPFRSAPASTCPSRSPSRRASARAARRSSPPAFSVAPTEQRSSYAGFTSTAARPQTPCTRAAPSSMTSSWEAPVRGRGLGRGATARPQRQPETRRSVAASLFGGRATRAVPRSNSPFPPKRTSRTGQARIRAIRIATGLGQPRWPNSPIEYWSTRFPPAPPRSRLPSPRLGS